MHGQAHIAIHTLPIHTLRALPLQFCALSQLPPECLMLVVRQLAAAPLAPWLFKQPWTEVQVPNPDDHYNYADYGPEYDYEFGFDGDGRCPECGEYHSDDGGAYW